MKTFFLQLLLLIFCNAIQAQVVRNNSFESGRDSANSLPLDWNYTALKIASVSIDSKHAVTGKKSLKMVVQDSTNFSYTVSQKIDINNATLKRIHITAWIKTVDCNAGVALLCTQKNEQDNKIDYTSTRQQDRLVKGSKEFTKTTLIVLVRPETQKLEIALCLYGSGTAWFDDIQIEEFNPGNKKTAASVKLYLDSLKKLVKNNSLYNDSINWKVFDKQLKILSTGMQSFTEAQLLANYIIYELKKYGDNHSMFMVPFAAMELKNGDIMDDGRKVVTEYLGNGIGYISMPGFGTFKDSLCAVFATYAQNQIKKIDIENKICAWVVDLREDNGGNCSAMVAGLGPILGDGITSWELSPKKDTIRYGYQNGKYYFEEKGKKEWTSTVDNPYYLKNKNVAIAVLTGPGCGSSGECAVAAFIGKANTKLFGQPTAGFTKGNTDFSLPDGSIILISSGIQTDRNGKKYPERIFPDVQVDESSDDKIDLPLERAKQWLLTSADCK